MTGEHYPPQSGEYSNQPSLYAELFTDFAKMAVLHGNISYERYEPLDPALESGRDGTVTADGRAAYGFEYVVDARGLPQALRDTGLVRIGIEHHQSVISKDGVRPESVTVSLHEYAGERTRITLSRIPETGDVTATTSVSVGGEDEPSADRVTLLRSVLTNLTSA